VTVPLIDLLLARIAEDKAAVRKLLDHSEGSPVYTAGMSDVDKLRAIQDEDGLDWWGEYAHLSISPARVLAECEAKKQIVTDIADLVLEPFGVQWPDGYKEALEHVLRLLALPYADQPGHREQWKP
jgi:hypothetical protein